MLVLILLGAMAVAFFVLMVIELVTAGVDTLTLGKIARSLADFLLKTVSAWASAVGFMTLFFMAAGRLLPEASVNLEDDWSPDELSAIVLERDSVSIPEAVINLAGLAAVTTLINFFPQVISSAENLLVKGGLTLAHLVNMEVFTGYVPFLTVLWLAEFALYATLLIRRSWNGPTRLWQLVTEAAGALILLRVASDARLYTPSSGLFGFRTIFLIIGLVSVAETAGLLWKQVQQRVIDKASE